MRANPIIKRGIAVFLLLVFFQQMGAGLFVHNLLHDNAPAGQFPVKKNESTKEISYACSCIDNFLMPFIEADKPGLVQKPVIHSRASDSYKLQFYFTSLIFSALRGPPVFIA